MRARFEWAPVGSIKGAPFVGRVSISRPSWTHRPCGVNVLTVEWSHQPGRRYLLVSVGIHHGCTLRPHRVIRWRCLIQEGADSVRNVLLTSSRLPGLVRPQGAARWVRRLADREAFAYLEVWMAKYRPPSRIPSRARREAMAEAIEASLAGIEEATKVRKFEPTPAEATVPKKVWELAEKRVQSKSDWIHLQRHASGCLEPHCPRCNRAVARISDALEAA